MFEKLLLALLTRADMTLETLKQVMGSNLKAGDLFRSLGGVCIVIAVLLYINPFRAPEQCIFDQAGFLCAKPIVFATTGHGSDVNVLHASLTSGQRQSIVITELLCLKSRLQPPGDPSTWGGAAIHSTDGIPMGYQETIDVGNFKDAAGNTLALTCVGATAAADGSASPLTVSDPGSVIRPGESFSGRLYVAYRYADDPATAPSKIVGANLVTQAQ